MKDNAVYKAFGELLLFNYIEQYLASKHQLYSYNKDKMKSYN